MTTPAGVTIGATWTAKRGRKAPDLTIVQIHRVDRCATVKDSSGHRQVVRWTDLRRCWRPA